MQKFLENHYKKIIFLILGFMLVVSILNAKNDSAIFDETAHIPAGYSYLEHSDMRLNPEHPPLIKDMAGFPLTFLNLNFGTDKDFWTNDVNGQWDAGRNLLWQEGNDADRIIFWSRVPIVLLSIILGLFIFKWARELAGLGAGLFALILYAFDPNILGHNHFVTTDLGIAAFGAFSFYYFLRFIKDPSWKNAAIGGIFLGLVQLAKFSSIMLFPIFGLVLVVYPFLKVRRNREDGFWSFRFKKLAQYALKGIFTFAVSLVLVWGIYWANTYKMPQEKLEQTIDFYFTREDQNTKTIYTRKVLFALNESNVTRPMSEYILGIAMVFKRVSGGNGAYFMGEVSSNAFPAYFPTVFLLKEPLPIIFFMLLALFLTISQTARNIASSWSLKLKDKIRKLTHFTRVHLTGLSLSAFIAFYSYVSVTGNLNIGFRHLFPILPFAYILTAKVIFDFLKRVGKSSLFIWNIILLLLSLLLIIETVLAYPAYTSYFNSAAGGPKNGYRYATDSNADWGQDLKRLKSWISDYNYCAEMKCDPNLKFGCPNLCYKIPSSRMPDNGKQIEKIRVNYFGGGDIFYYLGDRAIDWWDSKRPIEPGFYAISTNYLMGSLYDETKIDSESYRWIKNIKPIDQVGTSIFIYYITPQDIAEIK